MVGTQERDVLRRLEQAEADLRKMRKEFFDLQQRMLEQQHEDNAREDS